VTADAPDTPAPPCSACRGTGRVISQLGGERHEVTCPWCDGGGLRLREHDAQARWREQGDKPAPPAPDGADAA
jgi:hypothetical protein